MKSGTDATAIGSGKSQMRRQCRSGNGTARDGLVLARPGLHGRRGGYCVSASTTPSTAINHAAVVPPGRNANGSCATGSLIQRPRRSVPRGRHVLPRHWPIENDRGIHLNHNRTRHVCSSGWHRRHMDCHSPCRSGREAAKRRSQTPSLANHIPNFVATPLPFRHKVRKPATKFALMGIFTSDRRVGMRFHCGWPTNATRRDTRDSMRPLPAEGTRVARFAEICIRLASRQPRIRTH